MYRVKTLLLILVIPTIALAAITGSTDLGDGLFSLTVDHDPTASATDAPKGSVIVRESDGVLFVKTDDGPSTNVQQFTSASINDLAGISPTKGRLLIGNGTNWVLLDVGTDGQVLTADSAEATGIKWATP